jgi:hypothetical protein
MYLNHCTKCGQKCFYKQCFYIVKLQYESDFIFFNVHTKYKILPTNLIYVDLQIFFGFNVIYIQGLSTYVEPPLTLNFYFIYF